MNNYWALLPMRSSTDLIGDPRALRARLDEDSYLYLPGLIDPDRIQTLRDRMLDILLEEGWILGGDYRELGLAMVFPLREGDDGFAPVYDRIQKIEELHALAHDPALTSVMEQVVGPTAFPHPLKIARMAFPTNFDVATPPHQDYPNNQGTPDLTASWIPIGDCPATNGGLAILRGSHRYGVLPLDFHPGAGNRQAVLPDEMREQLHWVTTDFAAGDVLLFPSTTVHASLNNASDALRLSVDFRYQREGQPLTPIVLEPHFQRLSWDDVYENWSSEEHQYYWRDLDYEVVPFEVYPLVNQPPDAMPEAEMWKHLLIQKRHHDRRMERLATAGIVAEEPT